MSIRRSDPALVGKTWDGGLRKFPEFNPASIGTHHTHFYGNVKEQLLAPLGADLDPSHISAQIIHLDEDLGELDPFCRCATVLTPMYDE
jgi:hypothetical protein